MKGRSNLLSNDVVKESMTGGFALLAWPAKYAETGVVTLIINQTG